MIPLIFVFIKCENLILIIKIKKFMDPHDDQNQEFRRLDSKMIEDEIDNKDDIQAVHAYNDQDEIQLSQNFLFEDRESFE